MPKTKKKTEYKFNVKPPDNLMEEIQRLIDTETTEIYYRTPAEFVIESARLRVYNMKDRIQKSKELEF